MVLFGVPFRTFDHPSARRRILDSVGEFTGLASHNVRILETLPIYGSAGLGRKLAFFPDATAVELRIEIAVRFESAADAIAEQFQSSSILLDNALRSRFPTFEGTQLLGVPHVVKPPSPPFPPRPPIRGSTKVKFTLYAGGVAPEAISEAEMRAIGEAVESLFPGIIPWWSVVIDRVYTEFWMQDNEFLIDVIVVAEDSEGITPILARFQGFVTRGEFLKALVDTGKAWTTLNLLSLFAQPRLIVNAPPAPISESVPPLKPGDAADDGPRAPPFDIGAPPLKPGDAADDGPRAPPFDIGAPPLKPGDAADDGPREPPLKPGDGGGDDVVLPSDSESIIGVVVAANFNLVGPSIEAVFDAKDAIVSVLANALDAVGGELVIRVVGIERNGVNLLLKSEVVAETMALAESVIARVEGRVSQGWIEDQMSRLRGLGDLTEMSLYGPPRVVKFLVASPPLAPPPLSPPVPTAYQVTATFRLVGYRPLDIKQKQRQDIRKTIVALYTGLALKHVELKVRGLAAAIVDMTCLTEKEDVASDIRQTFERKVTNGVMRLAFFSVGGLVDLEAVILVEDVEVVRRFEPLETLFSLFDYDYDYDYVEPTGDSFDEELSTTTTTTTTTSIATTTTTTANPLTNPPSSPASNDADAKASYALSVTIRIGGLSEASFGAAQKNALAAALAQTLPGISASDIRIIRVVPAGTGRRYLAQAGLLVEFEIRAESIEQARAAQSTMQRGLANGALEEAILARPALRGATGLEVVKPPVVLTLASGDGAGDGKENGNPSGVPSDADDSATGSEDGDKVSGDDYASKDELPGGSPAEDGLKPDEDTEVVIPMYRLEVKLELTGYSVAEITAENRAGLVRTFGTVFDELPENAVKVTDVTKSAYGVIAHVAIALEKEDQAGEVVDKLVRLVSEGVFGYIARSIGGLNFLVFVNVAPPVRLIDPDGKSQILRGTDDASNDEETNDLPPTTTTTTTTTSIATTTTTTANPLTNPPSSPASNDADAKASYALSVTIRIGGLSEASFGAAQKNALAAALAQTLPGISASDIRIIRVVPAGTGRRYLAQAGLLVEFEIRAESIEQARAAQSTMQRGLANGALEEAILARPALRGATGLEVVKPPVVLTLASGDGAGDGKENGNPSGVPSDADDSATGSEDDDGSGDVPSGGEDIDSDMPSEIGNSTTSPDEEKEAPSPPAPPPDAPPPPLDAPPLPPDAPPLCVPEAFLAEFVVAVSVKIDIEGSGFEKCLLQRCIAGALGIQSSSVEVIELFEDARSARASLHLGAELQAITGFLVGKFRNVVDDASLVDSCANHGLDGVLGFSDVRELSLPPAPAIPIPSTGESGDGQSAKAQTTTTTTTTTRFSYLTTTTTEALRVVDTSDDYDVVAEDPGDATDGGNANSDPQEGGAAGDAPVEDAFELLPVAVAAVTTTTTTIPPDSTPPTIELFGERYIKHRQAMPYEDQGIKAIVDDRDGIWYQDSGAWFLSDGAAADELFAMAGVDIDTTTPGGPHRIIFRACDRAGNCAEEVREVEVVNPCIEEVGPNEILCMDESPPVCSQAGPETCGLQVQIDQGAENVPEPVVEEYVPPSDVTKPEIRLLHPDDGEAANTFVNLRGIKITEQRIFLDAVFRDTPEYGGGYVATDDFDGDITERVVVTRNRPLDTSVLTPKDDPIVITYEVSDASGNEALACRRKISVVHPCGDPTLMLCPGGECAAFCQPSFVAGGESEESSAFAEPEVAPQPAEPLALAVVGAGGPLAAPRRIDYGTTYSRCPPSAPPSLVCDKGAEASGGELPLEPVMACGVRFDEWAGASACGIDVFSPGDYEIAFTVRDASGVEAAATRRVAVRHTDDTCQQTAGAGEFACEGGLACSANGLCPFDEIANAVTQDAAAEEEEAIVDTPQSMHLLNNSYVGTNVAVKRYHAYERCDPAISALPNEDYLCEPGAYAFDEHFDGELEVYACPTNACTQGGQCKFQDFATKGLKGCLNVAAAEDTVFAIPFVSIDSAGHVVKVTRFVTIVEPCASGEFWCEDAARPNGGFCSQIDCDLRASLLKSVAVEKDVAGPKFSSTWPTLSLLNYEVKYGTESRRALDPCPSQEAASAAAAGIFAQGTSVAEPEISCAVYAVDDEDGDVSAFIAVEETTCADAKDAEASACKPCGIGSFDIGATVLCAAGTYKFEYTADDSSGNVARFVVTVHVVEARSIESSLFVAATATGQEAARQEAARLVDPGCQSGSEATIEGCEAAFAVRSAIADVSNVGIGKVQLTSSQATFESGVGYRIEIFFRLVRHTHTDALLFLFSFSFFWVLLWPPRGAHLQRDTTDAHTHPRARAHAPCMHLCLHAHTHTRAHTHTHREKGIDGGSDNDGCPTPQFAAGRRVRRSRVGIACECTGQRLAERGSRSARRRCRRDDRKAGRQACASAKDNAAHCGIRPHRGGPRAPQRAARKCGGGDPRDAWRARWNRERSEAGRRR